MYRLMIIDDEPYVRQQIRGALNWERLNIQIVGESANGLNGLKLSAELNPDIVICDIRMPQMDGISFATEFLRRFPAAQVIFLSAYADKMYMKKAIQLDVLDYVFKPFELSDLIAAVEKALKRLKMSAIKKTVRYYSQEDLLLRLLCDSSAAELTIDVTKGEFPIAFNKPYMVMLVRFNVGVSFPAHVDDSILDSLELQNQMNRYFYLFQLKFEEIFGDAFLMSRGGNCYVVLANLPEEVTLDMLCQTRIAPLLLIGQEFRLAIGVSRVYTTEALLKTAFNEARHAVNSVFLTGYGQICMASLIKDRQFDPQHSAKREYLDSLENHNFSGAASALNDYFVYIGNCSVQDISAIKEDLQQIAQQLNKKLARPPVQLVGEFVNRAFTLEDIRMYLQQLIEIYNAENEACDNNSRMIFEVEKYIMNHLGEVLSIKKIANHVHMSHTYLCYLYKKRTGRTLNGFILDARMHKARSLLLDTDMRVGDIALSLGYTNQNYFAKIFGSYYGTTPSKFRSEGRRY